MQSKFINEDRNAVFTRPVSKGNQLSSNQKSKDAQSTSNFTVHYINNKSAFSSGYNKSSKAIHVLNKDLIAESNMII